MRKNQKLLFKKIREARRHLTEEEIVDFYAKHVMQNTCIVWFNNGERREIEKKYWEIKNAAMNFYLRTIGRIVIDNGTPIWFYS